MTNGTKGALSLGAAAVAGFYFGEKSTNGKIGMLAGIAAGLYFLSRPSLTVDDSQPGQTSLPPAGVSE